MATSIAKPVKQSIAHYRLTPAIIGRELQKIFPGYEVRAFDIRASKRSSSSAISDVLY